MSDYKFETPIADQARKDYEARLLARKQTQTSPVTEAVAPVAQQAGASAAVSGAQSGDPLQAIGGAAMMSGNPYLMAGGLGLQVIAAGEQNKRQAEELQRKEYNDRIARRQQIMQNIAQGGIQ